MKSFYALVALALSMSVFVQRSDAAPVPEPQEKVLLAGLGTGAALGAGGAAIAGPIGGVIGAKTGFLIGSLSAMNQS
ncbi:hypothetical protein HK102_004258 [Quaeritorhiza haematococci]|nr:hypothetical protein HK102_000364 [Quaeritorhiza haematococci]KAJ3090276.1 hypothetical protein HK102_004258 [Quaeritorhiza haematococci]